MFSKGVRKGPGMGLTLCLAGALASAPIAQAGGAMPTIRPASVRNPTASRATPDAPSAPVPPRDDPRIRVVLYSADRIYRLRGYAGYQIDVRFAPGEHFEGAGVGDAKGVQFGSAANHLFIKPKAAYVATNLTVLTNRRTYLFEYSATPGPPRRDDPDVIYELRFEYPRAQARARTQARQRVRVDEALARAQHGRPRNEDYWYRGAPSLKPIAAWDDGVQTHLVFGARAELPAVFARNADGSESLVNFTMRGDDMVIQRIARRFVLRRGGLVGCIVNRGYSGSGRRLISGTLSPRVWREIRRAPASGGPVVPNREPGPGGRP